MGRPGFLRGIFGFILGAVIGAAIITLIRALMGLPYFSGSTAIFSGFGGLFGWLWGVGSFNPLSHEHNGFAHAHYEKKPSRAAIVMRSAAKATPGIVRQILPLVRPLVVALIVCAITVALFMAVGIVMQNRVQTDKPAASAVTTQGDIMLPLGGPDSTPVNKTVFFIIASAISLGLLGGMSVGLALLFNALSKQVNEVKKEPNSPPTEEPALFRLIDFFVTWINDILEGTKRSVTR
jgi:hypothetical protein